MASNLDIIDRLPFELAAALEADPFFGDIPVIVADAGNVKLELERKQAVLTNKSGKRGAAVIVLQLVANDDYPEVAFGPLRLFPAFQVLEHTEWNNEAKGTKKSHRRIARKIIQIIKPLGLDGFTTDFKFGKDCIEAVDLEDSLGPLVKASQVNCSTEESDSEELSQVSTPQCTEFAADTPKFQIICETAGAEIWWSADDSFPAPGRKGSQVYSGPVDIPAGGVTVRAAAYLAGMIGSRVSRHHMAVES